MLSKQPLRPPACPLCQIAMVASPHDGATFSCALCSKVLTLARANKKSH